MARRQPRSGTEQVTIAVSGVGGGGRTVDFRRLARQGMALVGRTEGFEPNRVLFADDLGANLSKGDANCLSVLDEADAYVESHGLDLPEEPEARILPPDPACVTDPALALDLGEAGISTILRATG